MNGWDFTDSFDARHRPLCLSSPLSTGPQLPKSDRLKALHLSFKHNWTADQARALPASGCQTLPHTAFSIFTYTLCLKGPISVKSSLKDQIFAPIFRCFFLHSGLRLIEPPVRGFPQKKLASCCRGQKQEGERLYWLLNHNESTARIEHILSGK